MDKCQTRHFSWTFSFLNFWLVFWLVFVILLHQLHKSKGKAKGKKGESRLLTVRPVMKSSCSRSRRKQIRFYVLGHRRRYSTYTFPQEMKIQTAAFSVFGGYKWRQMWTHNGFQLSVTFVLNTVRLDSTIWCMICILLKYLFADSMHLLFR